MDRAGFTLIEVLAALMIVALFTAVIAQMSVSSARLQSQTEVLLQATTIAQNIMALATLGQDSSGELMKTLKIHAEHQGFDVSLNRVSAEGFPGFEMITVRVTGNSLPELFKLERLVRSERDE